LFEKKKIVNIYWTKYNKQILLVFFALFISSTRSVIKATYVTWYWHPIHQTQNIIYQYYLVENIANFWFVIIHFLFFYTKITNIFSKTNLQTFFILYNNQLHTFSGTLIYFCLFLLNRVFTLFIKFTKQQTSYLSIGKF